MRDVACYCEMSTSTLYAAEGGEEMALSSFLRIFSFYLSEKRYVFDHHLLARLVAESMRSGGSLSLSLEGKEGQSEVFCLLKTEENTQDEFLT